MTRFVWSSLAICGIFLSIAIIVSSWFFSHADGYKVPRQHLLYLNDNESAMSTGGQNSIGDLAILASEYTDFREFVLTLKDRQFRSSAEIDWTLYKVKEISAERLSQAWLAYNVLLVSEHPDFRRSVLDTADYYGHNSFAEGVRTDQNYARTLNGSSSSIETAYRIAYSDVSQMNRVSRHLKKQAHTLQSKRWAMQRFDEVRRPKVAAIKKPQKSTVLESVISALGDEPVKNLQEATKENADGKKSKSNSKQFRVDLSEDDNASFTARTSVANKIATLAALKILGEENIDQFPADLTKPDKFSVQCFKRAQANLQQCLSAAHLRFEVPFCIAQHGVMEKSKCIAQ